MKRFYSIALAATCVLSASAALPLPHKTSLTKDARPFAKTHTIDTGVLTNRSVKAVAKAEEAPALESIIGDDYIISYIDEINQLQYSGELSIKAGTSAGDVTIVLPFDFSSYGLGETSVDIPAKYADGTLTFTPGATLTLQLGSQVFTDAMFLYHYNWDMEMYEAVESFTAQWDGKGFTFDSDDLIAMGDPYSEDGAWFGVDELSIAPDPTKDPNYDPNEGWTSLGEADFTDGWLLPMFNIDQTQNVYKVELQQNNDNKDLYRLVDPYHGNFPQKEYNECNKVGYIQFNVSDPDHVIFDPVEAGFANSAIGITKFYCLNTLTYYIGSFAAMGYPFSAEEVVQMLGDEVAYTTFKDGVVSLTSYIDPEEGEIYDACFGTQINIYGGYGWTPEDETTEAPSMEARIVFPGNAAIANVAADNISAPVEYFNLQGIRVAAPEAGQLLIRRQGTESKKIVF